MLPVCVKDVMRCWITIVVEHIKYLHSCEIGLGSRRQKSMLWPLHSHDIPRKQLQCFPINHSV